MIELLPYGPLPDQFGELGLPPGHASRPLVILIHGGFWRDQYRLDLMHPLTAELHRRGYATWNIEYRRVGPSGGGWDTTLDDVAAAIDRFAGLDWNQIAVIGHSAGGHLALWNASRPNAAVRADLTIGLAPVADVAAANVEGTGRDATTNFVGGSVEEFPERYAHVQPQPDAFDGRVVLVHGEADENVPHVQSTRLTEVVDAVHLLPGVDHFQVIDPEHASWTIVFEELAALLERRDAMREGFAVDDLDPGPT